MRFFENSLTVKTDSLFNFISSFLVNLVFAPLQLVSEIGKKVVYLQRRELGLLFFTSAVIGFAVTALTAAVQYFTTGVELVSGRVPLVIFALADVILVMVYVWFSSARLLLYDDLCSSSGGSETAESTLDKGSGKSKETPSHNKPDHPQQAEQTKCAECVPELQKSQITDDEDFADAEAWLLENDSFVAPGVYDVLNSDLISNYSNRMEQGIKELCERGYNEMLFPSDSLAKLEKKLNSVTPPSEYVDESLRLNLEKQLILDEADLLSNTVTEIPEDFTLTL